MSDENQNKPEGFVDPAAHNAEVAAQLAEQGRDLAKPADGLDASSALDNLVKEAEEKAKKEAEQSAAPAAPDPETKTEEQLAAEKAAEEAQAKKEADTKKADEYFKDAPSLAPNASPKSHEAFSSIKIRAAQEIAARDAELEKLRKERAEFEAKLKNPVPNEVTKELEDLRAWRAKLDVEADPKFKSFDKTVEDTRDFIYAQLKQSPVVTDDIIAEIKKHGGPDKVKMDKIFEAIKDPMIQQLVQSKLADIAQTKYNKEKAVESAKKNINEYLAERQKSAEEGRASHNTETEKKLTGLVSNLEWFKDKQVDPKAPEADRKATEEHNKFVATTRAQLQEALKDDSADMRAIMLTGMAQLFYLQKVHEGVLAKLTAAEKSLADVTTKYDKLRAGSVAKPSSAPASGTVRPSDKKDDFTTPAGDALDALARQVSEERARSGIRK